MSGENMAAVVLVVVVVVLPMQQNNRQELRAAILLLARDACNNTSLRDCQLVYFAQWQYVQSRV